MKVENKEVKKENYQNDIILIINTNLFLIDVEI